MAGLLSSAEITSITSAVSAALDQSLPVLRKTAGQDAYGHSDIAYTRVGTVSCNTFKPSQAQLSLYAEIIGTKSAMMLRFLPTSDVREGDLVTYNGKNWMVNNVLNAESYTVTSEALLTVVS